MEGLEGSKQSLKIAHTNDPATMGWGPNQCSGNEEEQTHPRNGVVELIGH